MPTKDFYHDIVKKALQSDGWLITHAPLTLRWEGTDVFVDLGAEQLLAAEKSERKIAVEIKSFIGKSPIDDLEKAIGQFVLYTDILTRLEPNRSLFLAVSDEVYSQVFSRSIGKLLLENNRLNLLMFNRKKEIIIQWIP